MVSLLSGFTDRSISETTIYINEYIDDLLPDIPSIVRLFAHDSYNDGRQDMPELGGRQQQRNDM